MKAETICCYCTLHDSTMALLDSTLFYHGSTWFYWPLHNSTMALLHSTWLYITLPWLYLTLLHSTLLYHGSTSLYFTLPCLYTWLYFTLPGSTWLYITLPCFSLQYVTIGYNWCVTSYSLEVFKLCAFFQGSSKGFSTSISNLVVVEAVEKDMTLSTIPELKY